MKTKVMCDCFTLNTLNNLTYPGLSSLALFTVGATTCVAGGETITDVVGAGESAGTGSTDTSVKGSTKPYK